MHVVYAIPAPMSKGPLGLKEMQRRGQCLSDWAFPGTKVSIREAPDGPESIESAYEEAQCVPAFLNLAMTLADEGVDAIIVGCAGDPGLAAAREILTVPVIGPGEASMLLACSMGHKFSVLSVFDSLGPIQRELAFKSGCLDKLASVRGIGIPVLDMAKNPEHTLKCSIEAGRKAIELDGADVLMMGCMSLSFTGIADEISDALNVPVINAGLAALKAAEMMASMKLSHSKRAYPAPPKMGQNKTSN